MYILYRVVVERSSKLTFTYVCFSVEIGESVRGEHVYIVQSGCGEI